MTAPTPDARPPVSAPRRRTLLAALAAPWVLPRARAQGVVRLRFSHVVAEETPKGRMARRLQALLHERSGGRIRLDVYPQASLYGDADEIEAAQLGAVELLAPSLSKFGRLGLAEFELFDLPFLFRDRADVARVTAGAIGRELLQRLQPHGLVGLGYLDNGLKHMSANRPLRTARDYAGLRMRVQPSRTIAAQMRALGAHPVVLDFSDTRRALATGVVDGTENPLSNFWTQRMHEVQSHLTLTGHGYLGYAIVVGAGFWRHLSPADRALLQACVDDALSWGNTVAAELEAQALAAVRAAGTTTVHSLSAPERDALRQATQPVYTAFAQRVPGRWAERVQAAIG
jgi:C4-dicarboxylate-binding protein DctP